MLSPIKEVYMSDDEVEALTTMYTFLHKEDTIVMFPNCHVNFHSCYFMTRKLTPGIQEVSSQPVYLPDGMVQMVWTQFQWICGHVSWYILWFKSSFKFFKLV